MLSQPGDVVPHTDSRMESKRLKTGADRSVDVQDTERVEAQRLVGVLNSLVRGMTGARFGISAEAAVHCDAEHLRETVNTWQAMVVIKLSRISAAVKYMRCL